MDLYSLTGPLLRLLPPEAAHRLAIRALRLGLGRPRPAADDPVLGIRLWGLDFPNPLGIAAGFDKNAEVPDALLDLGFGFVEIGTVTPRPQAGNPKPRLFRLVEDEALINRLGFNNEGLPAVRRRLARRGRGSGIVGANLGRNRDSEDAAADYVAGVEGLAGLVDYLVINVSSPNTPGLRALQGRAALDDLLAAVGDARRESRPPLLLKVAPDLSPEDRRDIATVALARGVDGLIVSNTTVARPPGLKSRHRGEEGGLSGRPLFPLATEVLRDLYRLTEGRIPLIGVGGIFDGRDALAKIRAGAALVQIYTGLVYRGPGAVSEIKRELAALLRAEGFGRLEEAIGADHR